MKKKLLLVASGLVVTFAVFYVTMWLIHKNNVATREQNLKDLQRKVILESGHWSEAEKADQIRIWEYNDKHK